MKFSLVLILTLVGVILFGVFYDNKRVPSAAASPAGRPFAASSLSSHTPSPSSLLSKLLSSLPSVPSAPSSSGGQAASTLISFFQHAAGPSITPRAALMIAHGTLKENVDAGVLVDCGLPYSDPASKNPLSVGPTNEIKIRRVKFAREAEAQYFGPLTRVRGGIVQASDIDPGEGDTDKYLVGIVLVVGYPASTLYSSRGLNLVVAPAAPLQWQGKTYQTVTATFNMEAATPAPSGWWMWHKREAGTVFDLK